jgi:hypothetical protein
MGGYGAYQLISAKSESLRGADHANDSAGNKAGSLSGPAFFIRFGGAWCLLAEPPGPRGHAANSDPQAWVIPVPFANARDLALTH